jgi:predicted CXXCH cytochrome family protein
MRRTYSRYIAVAVLVASCILLSACSIQRTVYPSAAHRAKHSGCVACHRLTDPSVDGGTDTLFPSGSDPAEFCLDCHQNAENHHPVGIAPQVLSSNGSMSAFPLFDGKITCLTCHVAHAGPRLEETHKLLRGGPYADRREICFRCHFKESYASINPHRMLEPDGTIRQIAGSSVCLLCHLKEPRRDSRPEEVAFQADIAFLCWRCHPPMPGDFLQKHFQRKPREKTRQIMQETERSQEVALPLTVEGKISCSTCHNPHQPGVLERRTAQAGAGAHGRLRVARHAVCSACHTGK